MSAKNSGTQLRKSAAKAIYDVLEQGRSTSQILPPILSSFSSQDRAWLQQMVYGVLRELPQLQEWVRARLDKPLKGRHKIVEHLLMLGFYQLAYTRVSEHAAVSETVAACEAVGSGSLKGLVNACLRGFIRDEQANQISSSEIVRSRLPKWLYKSLASAYSQNAEQFSQIIAGSHQQPPIWLRVNTQKQTRDQFSQALTRAGIAFEQASTLPDALIAEPKGAINHLPGFDKGDFAVQDGAAQWAAHLLGAKTGERILDCCAAPGGKTCHIGNLCPDLSELVALDSDKKRMLRVKENAERLNVAVSRVIADAAKPDSWWDGKPFDRILLDAPCSATGVIRRHPDIKWLRKRADIDSLASQQAQLLDTMWSMLKPGGTLLYATCSILPQENREQIQQFLSVHSDARLDDLGREPGHGDWQILPGQEQMDGFYYARLIKSS